MKKTLLGAIAAVAMLSVSTPVGAIVNGQPDTTHDYVGAMRGFDPGGTQRLCSGSLIATGVFLSAAHCMGLTGITVHFGDDLATEDFSFAATAALRHPSNAANFGFQFDVGIVLFDQGDVVLPTGQLAPQNYLDGFTTNDLKNATFETYGYGLVRGDVNGNSEPLSAGTVRRGATQSYRNMHNQYLGLSINSNQGSGGGCSGDSGGPHLLNNLIVSVTSNGDASCVATDNTQRVDQPEIRNWILSVINAGN